MSDKGYVAVSRGVFDHPLLHGKERCDAAAWVWLIKEAAWREHRVFINGQMITLQRGQLAHSLGYMAREWKWSVKEVRTFLKRWMREGALSAGTKEGTRGGTRITIITLCNYDIYQGEGHERGTTSGTTGAQQGQQVNQVTIKPEERGGGIGVAPAEIASPPDFKKLAWDLNVKLWIIFGIDPEFPHPSWCGLAHALEAGLRGNTWDPEICRIAAVKLAARKKPKSFRYLLEAIDSEHQETAAMLKRMEASNVVQPHQRELALITPISGGARKGGGFAAVGQKAFKAGGRT